MAGARCPWGASASRLAVCLTLLLALPAVARAQVDPSGADPLSRAEDAYARGDFEAAVAAYRASLQQDEGLSRAELEEALWGLAVVQHALDDADAVEATLRRVLAMAPETTVDPRAPPSLRARFEALRADVPRMRLEVQEDAGAADVEVRARVLDDPGLLRAIHLLVQAQGGWRDEAGAVQRVPFGARYYVEARGPGGAVLVSDGSATEPRTAPSRHDLGVEPPVTATEPADSDVEPWIWGLSVVAGVLVLGAVASGLYFGLQDSPTLTHPSAPMER